MGRPIGKPVFLVNSVRLGQSFLTYRPVIHMTDHSFILASSSQIRADLLRRVGLNPTCISPRVDEDLIKQAMLAEDYGPRDIADALADAKSAKIAAKHPDSWVLGCDQVLEHQGELLSKPASPNDAKAHLQRLRGSTHRLISAAVLYHQGKPNWRHITQATLTVRPLSDDLIEDYVARNWDSIRHSVGAYKIEEEGARLFLDIKGDPFTIMGLPLFPLLSHLGLHGLIAT